MIQDYDITTVTGAATYTDLTTVANVKLMLGITDASKDAVLALLIRQVSAAIENRCERQFALRTYQTIYRRGDGISPVSATLDKAPLVVPRWPIVSIASVTESDGVTTTTLVAGTDYEVDARLGLLFRLASTIPARWVAQTITVTYDAGYTVPASGASYTLPADLESVAIEWVRIRYYAIGRDLTVRASEVTGIGRTEYSVGAGMDHGLPQSLSDILDNYRVPQIG